MTKRCFIIILSLWVGFPAATCAGTASKKNLKAFTIPVLQNEGPTQKTETIVAQNDKKKTSEGVRSHDVEKADEDATRPNTSTPEKNSQKKTKQLKPFTPSETIPADQGVDFPYDI